MDKIKLKINNQIGKITFYHPKANCLSGKTINNLITLLEKADKQIKDYLDRPIPIQYPKVGGKIQNLYPLIQLKISDYYNRLYSIILFYCINNILPFNYMSKNRMFSI